MADHEEAATRFLPDTFKQKRAQRKARAAAPAPAPAPAPITQDMLTDDEPADDIVADDGFDDSNEQPAPAPAPAPAANETVLLEKIERLLDGITTLQRENAELRRQIDNKDKPVEPKKKRIDVAIEGADVDEKMLNEQFPTLLPTVRAIARREVKVALEALAPQLERLFDETDQAVTTAREQANAVVKNSFERDVNKAVPDLAALNREQRFNAFIDQQAPYQQRGVTLRHLLSHAWKNQDVDAIVQIVADYKATLPKKPAPTQVTTAIDQFVQPSSPRGGAPQVRSPNAVGKLKQSDWNKARMQLTRGELTAAEYAPIKAKFEKAKSEGRLVDDTAAPASSAA